MVRLVVVRKLFAPIAIAVSTTVVPPATAIFSPHEQIVDGEPPAVVISIESEVLADAVRPLKQPTGEARPSEKTVLASLSGSTAMPEVRRAETPVLPPVQVAALPKDIAEELPAYAMPAALSSAKTADERASSVEIPTDKRAYAGLPPSAAVKDAVIPAEPADATPEPSAGDRQIVASLGRPAETSIDETGSISSNRSTRMLFTPPEAERVAYDAPPPIEMSRSISKQLSLENTAYAGLGSPEALLEALKWMGSNASRLGVPPKLWCADFMNFVLRRSGLDATGSRAAKSYLKYGQRISEPRVGAIAIFSRGKNGGHIGIVRGTDGSGNPIVVSGNHGNKVAEAVYSKDRVLAYVVPYPD